ncbi:MAG: hypothetical protein ACM3NH_01630 [Candidatus Saccharibacteria bacterium]
MRLLNFVKLWLPLAVIITVVFGTVYAVVQQNYRMNANDPQIQIVQDVSDLLATGQDPQNAIPQSTVDVSRSLAPFIIVFDDKGTATGSSVTIGTDKPVPPAGVFDKARTKGENRFTWQPQKGVRIAAVLAHYEGSKPGFVLVGRSLREVERRESMLLLQVAVAWAVSIIVSAFLVVLNRPGKREEEQTAPVQEPPVMK